MDPLPLEALSVNTEEGVIGKKRRTAYALAMLKAPTLLALLFITPLLAPAADQPGSFGYVLQADALATDKKAAIVKLAESGRDWLVLDTVFNEASPWQREDLDAIRKGKPGRKIVAYVSIGEAEDYRPYWKKDWVKNGKRTDAAPSWLGEVNPDWEGNFRVKYWASAWQEIMLPVIAKMVEEGFDGVYLDIVDGFETWEFDGKDWVDNRSNPETNQTYRRDMVEWVKAIAARARQVNPEAIVIPQNGSQLLEHPDFLEAASAIGIEDLFTEGDARQSTSHTKEILPHLAKMAAAGKPVLVIEYPTRTEGEKLAIKRAHENGLVWLVTDRKLKTLGKSGN